jgi:hypothetical protein
LLPTQRREQHGRILRRLHATNGYAGLSPSRSRRPEDNTSRGRARSLKKACVDHAVGLVALTAKKEQCPRPNINYPALLRGFCEKSFHLLQRLQAACSYQEKWGTHPKLRVAGNCAKMLIPLCRAGSMDIAFGSDHH